MAMNSRMIPNSSIYSGGAPTRSRATSVVCQTRVPRNANMERLQSGYLFPEIEMKRNAYMQKYPDAKLINLGVGDTTEPIPKIIASTMAEQCYALSTYEGYLGYGPEAGNTELRDVIAKFIYKDTGINGGEVFISDGAQSDIARVQLLFGSNVTIAVQDPSFPAYIDCGVMMGQSGEYIPNTGRYQKFEYMKCTPENDFFPDLSIAPRTDVIFFCSPNNPTGHAASKEQLEQLVGFARSNGSIVVIDTAYSAFISDDNPKSIYEIPGSKEVAIEISSFSKFAGFTGVRLGWTVVPKELRYLNNFQVMKDFDRVVCTTFNGASRISQAGGLACLSPKGNEAIQDVINVYRQNTQVLAYALKTIGVDTYGGKNSPYVWAHFPGRKSWDVFNELLNEAQVITIPGIGFGPGGEGFIRFSAFSRTKDVHEACRRLQVHFNK